MNSDLYAVNLTFLLENCRTLTGSKQIILIRTVEMVELEITKR
jgi:hypothetical protein